MSHSTDSPTFERQHALQVRLTETQRVYLAARRDAETALSERDDAILEATDSGLSRRDVAALLGVTAGRIQQIIDSRERRTAQRWQRLIPPSHLPQESVSDQ
jgi:DNA-directed RNA polymerase specialized sigma subunit